MPTKSKNRNPVKQLFITFPKSTVSKTSFRDKLLRFDPHYYKIVEEKHQDGTPHLHAIIKFKNKYSISYILKYFKEQYPNDYKRIDVEPIRSISNAVTYLSKEDPSPLEHGEAKTTRSKYKEWHHNFARELGYNDVHHLLQVTPKDPDRMKRLHSLFIEKTEINKKDDIRNDITFMQTGISNSI